MAETCIVCLGDLAPQDEGPTATESSLATASLVDGVDVHPRKHEGRLKAPVEPLNDDELVAHLLPCGHDLHNECLKPWVERANSCPICRASFNMVQLSARVGGPKLSEYAVQDKQQVADIDPSMIIEEDYTLEEDDGSYDACMVCDEFGEASQLMYCHSCEQLCHVFCAGLDRMPSRGPWYCHGCVENPGMLEAASQRRPAARGPAAWVNGRSRVPRHNRAPDEWVGVWQSVWDRLQFDIEFPFEDDEQSENPSEILRRDNQLWERRFALAQRVGAGTRFRAAADNIQARRRGSVSSRPTNRALHRDPPKTPKDPESQEELRAWNQFEKARELLAQTDGQPAAEAPSTTSSRRGRKRKSIDSSPAESEPREQKPERKLKRPRTRIHTDSGEPSSASIARRNTVVNPSLPAPATSPPAAPEASSNTGFLQSLLQEVEVDRFAERDKEIAAPQPRRVIVERACSPQNSSPGLSPVYQKPHGMATPPPLNLSRTKSPVQQDEQHSPTYSPFSPADEDRLGRRKLPHRSAGLSSPPRSKDTSPSRPTLSYSTKAELQRMVTAVLKPLYQKKEVTKEEYTEINRDVSRLLYEKVGGAGADALADQDTREKWQQMATGEVDNAMKALRAGAAALSPEDSTSSSS